MTKNKPLLSICIPTIDRAETLNKTLLSLTSDAFFKKSNLVEIVISDNFSSDHTASVVKKYSDQFPNKIIYHRTPSNLLEGNFEIVLRKARGTFRKLQNDTFGIQPGLLEALVKIISSLQAQKPVVFLINEEPKSGEETLQQCQSMDEFLAAASYKSTWIGGFGIWAEDLNNMKDFSRAVDLKLTQTDVLLRMVAKKKNAVVIREFIQNCFWTGRKSGVNIPEVFGANYLRILKEHVTTGALSSKAYAIEKKKVLIEHTLPFVFNKDHDFTSDNMMHHLRDYQGEPYFLNALESARAVSIRNTTPSGLTRPTENFSQQWRNANLHNETSCTYPISMEKISVGRRTYGAITAMTWGHPNEHIKIGSFCSIGGGVEFLLGGNHAMNGITTFPIKVKYFGHQNEALTKGPIVVGDDVWIGNRAIILSGTKIGQGAVIGASSVVSGYVPPYAVVAGNPAKIIRYRFSPEVIEKLLELDYNQVTDDAIHAMGDRMYEPITDSNVASFVRQLMNTAPADDKLMESDSQENCAHIPEVEQITKRNDEFNLFKKQQSVVTEPVKIAFIGNSITLHGPAPEIGWTKNNGMAASVFQDDYCNTLLNLLHIESSNAFIENFAEAERTDIQKSETTQSITDLLIKNKPNIVIIQLGDNVNNAEQLINFKNNIFLLASIAKQNSERVFILSTWWESVEKDQVIKAIAESTQSEYIYIGDLYNSNQNTDR
jgi:acetyltransferase-like isoleucine patch superfamily enzyme/glycosyltransferase involved in cell wall biosynthesis